MGSVGATSLLLFNTRRILWILWADEPSHPQVDPPHVILEKSRGRQGGDCSVGILEVGPRIFAGKLLGENSYRFNRKNSRKRSLKNSRSFIAMMEGHELTSTCTTGLSFGRQDKIAD